jgi:pantoate--beta-alanine ligase
MRVCATIAEVRAARLAYPTLGLVPTMGFLHAGHISLVEAARADNEGVAASLFVNPTQFGPNEDFDRYPRARERDLQMLEAAGCDLVFAPDVAEMYPVGFDARIEIGGVTEGLEGAVRPGHFAGVATVVAKLFNITTPTRAYFGQKDAQQVAVIRKLVRDLDMPLEVVVRPTVREPDGLAMSSRNAYLTAEQRQDALALWQGLSAAKALYEGGERRAERLRAAMAAPIAALGATADYLSVADPLTLGELEAVGERGALLSLAVRIGTTRLIDNILLV